MNKYLKTISINLIIFFLFIILIELFFGYWFSELNFGPHMRGKRVQKIVFYNHNEKINYFRDYYGFRENNKLDKKYNTGDIKIVFNGGSTGDEMFLNYKDTIVGKINEFLQLDNINLKIYNASLSGKSLKGKINEFEYWFDKIPKFKPDIIIYYLGINDRHSSKNRWHDFEYRYNLYNKVFDTITQKSFFWEKIKFVKDKYFFDKRDIGQYYTDGINKISNLNGKNFISYSEAKKLYVDKNIDENLIVENYKKNLLILKKKLDQRKIKPIFITQITYDINGKKKLFFLNEELKKFSQKNNLHIIKLDEIVNEPMTDSFIDEIHTNKNGSLKISKLIYPHLKKILLDYYE